MAAIAAARTGMHVVLLEPGTHVGGMLTGGLSATDVGNPNVIGGEALEFFERVGKYYDVQQYGQKVSWRFEPHVGEEILRSMLQDAKWMFASTSACVKRMERKNLTAESSA